jgi:hypothetical protein
MRTIVIGDVHGCLDELLALLKRCHYPDTPARLIFVGDLIDKGPKILETLLWVYNLQHKTSGMSGVVVMGNHEEKNARYWYNKKIQDKTGEMAALDRGLKDLGWRGSRVREWVEGMPLYYELPEHNVTVVHGGIPSSMQELPKRYSKEREDLKMLRTRYVTGRAKTVTKLELTSSFVPRNLEHLFKTALHEQPGEQTKVSTTSTKVTPAGSFLAMNKNGPDDPFWADAYDGRFGYVYYGHEAWTEDNPEGLPRISDHAAGLDTGCVLGHFLSAVVLEKGARSFVSVRAGKKYCEKRGE